jgi:transposase
MPPEPKLTPEVIERVALVVRAGGTFEVAAAVAGVSERTLYDWMHRGDPARAAGRDALHRQLRAAVEAARAERETILVAQMTRAASRGSWRAAAWLLERQFPSRWGPERMLSTAADAEHLEAVE